jgi:hypothetical protein
MLAVLCAAVMCLAACAGGDPTASEHTATGPWKRWTVTPPEAFGDRFTLVYVSDIAPPTSGQPWTAVGYLVGVDGDRHPKAWTSRDGATWEAEDLPPSSSSVRWDRPFDALRSGEDVVVFGLKGERGDEGITAWHRDESGTWTTLATVEALGSWSFDSVADVALAPDGLVAVTARHGTHTSNVNYIRSADGRSWTVESGRLLGSDIGRRIDAFGVTVAHGRQVVVGRSWPLEPPFDDKDGEIWSHPLDPLEADAVPVDLGEAELGGPGYEAVQDVVPFGSGFVAVGIDSDQPVAWVSPDGRKWSAYAIESVEDGAGASKLAVVGGRLVAVGKADRGPRLAVWTSADGRRWERLQLPRALTRLEPAERHDVVGGPGGSIAIVASNDVESEIYIGRP